MTDDVILQNLLSRNPRVDSDWEVFLRRFSNLILKVVWQFEKDYDEAMEKYLFVCRKLAEKDFARLRRFQSFGENSPRFSTWLAAITRNLCIDAHRSRHGRKQLPRAIMKLGEFDREVFRLFYWRGFSLEELEQRMQVPGKDPSLLTESIERIQSNLTGATTPVRNQVTVPLDENTVSVPSTEMDDDLAEMQNWLQQWIGTLNDQERMIIRLRFWEDMTGPEIADAMRISPEGKVYPLLKKTLAHLREQAGKTYNIKKSGHSSVLHKVKGQRKNAS